MTISKIHIIQCIMFLRRKNKEKTPPPSKPKWLVYGVVGFVLLMAMQVSRAPRETGEPPPALAPIAKALPDASIYQQSLPSSSTNISIRDTQIGTGNVILCGQAITASIHHHEDETSITFTSGDPQYVLLTQLVTTMRVGGTREATFGKAVDGKDISPALQGSVSGLAINITSASPDMSSLFLEKQLMLETTDTTLGDGAIARCGDTVQAHISLYGSNGLRIADTPATLTLGAGDAMLGIEQGMIGMRKGGARMLVLPPAWQGRIKSTESSFPKDLMMFTRPTGGIAVVKVRLLEPTP
jgi:hypothetical protein